MTDLLVRVRDNNRRIVRGGWYDDTSGRLKFQVSQGETIKVTLNLSDWLNGATVSSSSLTNSGVTVTKAESSGVFTLTASNVSGYGYSDLTITASDGRIRLERFRFEDPLTYRPNDYGWPH
jgi:hypothetical protein